MKFSSVKFRENPKAGSCQGSVAGRQTDRRVDGRGLRVKLSLSLHKEPLVTTTSHGKPCDADVVYSNLVLCPAHVYVSQI